MSFSLFSPIDGDAGANLFPIRQQGSTECMCKPTTSFGIKQQIKKIPNEQPFTKYLSFSSVVDITNPNMKVDKVVASQNRKTKIEEQLLKHGFKLVEGTDTYKDKHLTVHLTSGKNVNEPHSLSPLTKAFAVSSAIGYCLLYLIAGLVLGAIFLCTGLTGIWASKSVRDIAKSFFGALVARAQFQTGTWCSSNRVNCVTLTTKPNKKVTLGAQPSLYVEMNKHAKSGEKPKTHPDIVAAKHRAVFSIQDRWERRAHGIARPLNAKEWNDRGVDYIEMNVPDHSGMSCEQLESAAFVMRLFAERTDDRDEQQGIYVHCKAGQGRSAQVVAADKIMNDSMHWVDASMKVQQEKNGTTLWKPEKTGALKPFQAHAEFREIQKEAFPLLLKAKLTTEKLNYLKQHVEVNKNNKHEVLRCLKDQSPSAILKETAEAYRSFLAKVEEIYKRREKRIFFTSSVPEISNKKGKIKYKIHKSKIANKWTGTKDDFQYKSSKTAIQIASLNLIEGLKQLNPPLGIKEQNFLLKHSLPEFLQVLIVFAEGLIVVNGDQNVKALFKEYLEALHDQTDVAVQIEQVDRTSVEQYVEYYFSKAPKYERNSIDHLKNVLERYTVDKSNEKRLIELMEENLEEIPNHEQISAYIFSDPRLLRKFFALHLHNGGRIINPDPFEKVYQLISNDRAANKRLWDEYILFKIDNTAI